MSDDNSKAVVKTGLLGVVSMAVGTVILGPAALAPGFIFGVSKMVGAAVDGEEGAKAIGTIETLTNVASGINSINKK